MQEANMKDSQHHRMRWDTCFCWASPSAVLSRNWFMCVSSIPLDFHAIHINRNSNFFYHGWRRYQ